MTTAVRETRTPNEVAAQRAAAVESGGDLMASHYEMEKARAVLDALDWIEGRTLWAPITGGHVEPTERAIGLERRRAEDAEALALSRGLDGTWPGMVGVVLSWYHRRAFCEAPY